MDDFRKLQKQHSSSAVQTKNPYGCGCCRMLACLNHHKKLSRKLARHQLNNADRRDNFGLAFEQ